MYKIILISSLFLLTNGLLAQDESILSAIDIENIFKEDLEVVSGFFIQHKRWDRIERNQLKWDIPCKSSYTEVG
tara:strand:+ start:119 stop:340 length:222 start_codon:yes stop_codon:yes gene_type:complete